MDRQRKLMYLYVALLLASAAFFTALFMFVADARKLHSEGTLRRPPKHIRVSPNRLVEPQNVSAPTVIPPATGTVQ